MAELITVEKAAEILGVSKPYIRQLLKDKVLQGVRTPASNVYRSEWRINKDSVVRYAATRRPPGRPKK